MGFSRVGEDKRGRGKGEGKGLKCVDRGWDGRKLTFTISKVYGFVYIVLGWVLGLGLGLVCFCFMSMVLG